MLQAAFDSTALTPEHAHSSKTVMKWQEQPSHFKHYPDFLFRYLLDPKDPFDHFIIQIRTITQTLNHYEKPYHRLNVPSAGNLHPIEVYFQLRKIPGKLSGIYHLDVAQNAIVLIQEIAADGVEPLFGYQERQAGLFVFFSTVYFRSSWKYGLRAWRYQLLDMGHQIAALQAAAHLYDKPLKFENMTPCHKIESTLGFTQEEQLLCAASLVTPLARKVLPLEQNCMQVQPTDYFYENSALEKVIKHCTPYNSRKAYQSDYIATLSPEQVITLNQKRRSARKFSTTPIKESLLEQLMHFIAQADCAFSRHYVLLNSCCQASSGIYDGRTLLKKGSFVHEINYLLLGQTLANTSAIVLFLSLQDITAQAFYDAGVFAHELYLFCTENNLGCSSVGAYLDEETKHFLHTNEAIIYCITIGNLEVT
ncbi:MAG: nitroreductase family protein [Epsilonproteobacteria bacterium]|nr:nitroreductase family protein [Campylobacterota bacterium]